MIRPQHRIDICQVVLAFFKNNNLAVLVGCLIGQFSEMCIILKSLEYLGVPDSVRQYVIVEIGLVELVV